MNKGDTISLILNFQLNNEDFNPSMFDEIELQLNEESGVFNNLKLLMSTGDIEWDDSIGKYVAYIPQNKSFKLSEISSYQIRVLLKDSDEVTSSDIYSISFGGVLSKKILKNE